MLVDTLKKRILLLDGAIATMLMPYAERRCETLVLSDPGKVADLHSRYLEAGADIITTDTFAANRLALSDVGLQDDVFRLNELAARLARREAARYSTAAKPRFVLGSIGPFGGEAPLEDVYREQIEGLVAGGVDAIILETLYTVDVARSMTEMLCRVLDGIGRNVPFIVSAAVNGNGEMIASGESIDDFMDAVIPFGPVAIGVNCGCGAKSMVAPALRMASRCTLPLLVSPNAGQGSTASPEEMLLELAPILKDGLINILGGCCGTTPEYIRRFGESVSGLTPRKFEL